MSVRTLWVTNDLPPRTGGIQQFVVNLLRRVHTDTTVVIGPGGDAGVDAADAAEEHRTVRAPGALLPTPATLRLIVDVARTHRPDVIVLGAAWPLGELAGPLRQRLGVPVVALTHGLEAGMAGAGLGHLIARATRHLDAATTISAFTAARLEGHLRAARVRELPPGVDLDRFTPQVDGAPLRRRFGLPSDAVVVGCVSRLVPRKGQDMLLAAWPEVVRRHPDAWLVLVGEGPLERRLRARADALGREARVALTGPVGWEDLPATYAALDLFAMPCRTRWAGLDVEGLGIVYLEAQASGVPVIAGRSGGAPETVLDPRAGVTVDGRDRDAVTAALLDWVGDADRRRAARSPARDSVSARYGWTVLAARFEELLDEVVADTGSR